MEKKKEPAADTLALVKEKAEGMKIMVAEFQVNDDKSLEVVADKIKQIKTLKKFITGEKDKFVEPAKAIIAEAKDKYDPFIKECDNAEIVLKQRAKAYMLKKDDERKKGEDKIAAKVESGYIKPETAMRKMEQLPETPNTVRTDAGSGLRMSKRRVAKITNPDLIPDEYWVIDEVRVRREALQRDKEGAEQIPGVTIEEETDLASV
jgi:hypothetical protein